MLYFSTLLISMFITISLIPLFRRAALKLNVMDVPDSRKIHSCPIPKCGGLAMAFGVLLPVLFWQKADAFVWTFVAATGLIVLFGVADDLRDLNYKTKFAGQIVAALLVILIGGVKITSLGMLLPDGVVLPDWLAVPLTLIVIVGVTNSINLADGLDGLAGGISVFIFVCIGYLAYQTENTAVVILCMAMIGALFGFLRFNSYPAQLFMGDAGSQMLGFTSAVLALCLTQQSAPLSPLLPLILLGFPILDTFLVMAERVRSGKSPFAADKRHFHHKLLAFGLYHSEAVFLIYLLQAFLVSMAFVLRFYSDWLILVAYLVFSGIVLSFFEVVGKTGRQLERPGALLDKTIKFRLSTIKKAALAIKV